MKKGQTSKKLSGLMKKLWLDSEWRRQRVEAYNRPDARKKKSDKLRDFHNLPEVKTHYSEMFSGSGNPNFGKGANSGSFYDGQTAWNKGLTKETDERVLKYSQGVSESRKGKYAGSNAPNWQGGKSFELYGIEFTEELKRTIRDRDEHICQSCGELENGKALDVHHVDVDKLNNVPENLISLCKSCHMRVHSNSLVGD